MGETGNAGPKAPRSDPPPARAPRKPRADSLRNRERLLTAARAVFAEGGPDASLEAVARRAGLGIGTLYRHFPTRETLFLAVYRREAEELAALAESLVGANDPVEALRRWLHAAVGMVATKKGMVAVLSPSFETGDPRFAEVKTMLLGAIEALTERAVDAGAIRADIPAADVMQGLFSFCYSIEGPDWQPAVLRLLDVFVDGLRLPSVER